MGILKQVSNSSKKPLNVFLTFILAIVGLLILLQAFAWSVGGETAAIYAQDSTPVATPTMTTQERLDDYIEAHIIQGDVMPTPAAEQPETPEIEEPQLDTTAAVSYSVALLADMVRIGKPGDMVTYTLVLSNPGTMDDVYDITSVAAWPITIPVDVFTLTSGTADNVIVTVAVPPGAAVGDEDTAVITATSQTDSAVTASAFLTTTAGLNKVYFPLVFKPLPIPSLSATRPNSANDWQMNWTISDNSSLTGYELQQSQDSTFATGITTYNAASTAISHLINSPQPSANNVYYFRLRAVKSGLSSDWSNVVTVVGAYYDEFTSNQTGWSGPTLKDALRRLTYIEKIDSWYENGQWLILRVEDSYDWAIASPMMPAPLPPYVIEFRSKPANLGNLVSHGVVFGGDWNGAPCPDWSTIEGVYYHKNCFNHFYNSNLIWSSSSDMTLLWERIDELVWCPKCGGSPLKRLGDTHVKSFKLSDASDWNNYRIEVRDSEIKLFINGTQKYSYDDTRWIDGPYFGVFASADEYSNSTWRWEYYKVTPLDN